MAGLQSISSIDPGAHFDAPRRGWGVVACLAAIAFVVSGSSVVAIGLFISPMMAEFGWPNGLTSGTATAFNLAALFAGPVVGPLLDRLGARPIMALGVLLSSTGFLIASRCHTFSGMLAAFALSGVGYCASFYLPGTVVVADWMKRQRSLGMGIVLGAAAGGSAVFSPIIGLWVEKHGWRVAAALISMILALTLPVILLVVRRSPWEDSQKDDSVREVSSTRTPGKDVVLSSVFILSIASSALFAIGMGGVQYHVVSVLVKAGYSADLANLVFGATWLLAALGSVLLGVAADSFGAKRILATALLSGSIGTVFLLGADRASIGTASVVLFTLLWGTPSNGAFQLVPVIFAERFGSGALGTLIGIQSAIAGAAAASGPVVTGMLYDRFGNYHAALYLSALTTFAAFVLALLINRPNANSGMPTGPEVTAVV